MGKFINAFCASILVCTYSFLSPTKAASIVATVNNKAITSQDLKNRIKLAIVSSGLPNNEQTQKQLREQVLDTIINEQIKLQLGDEFKLTINNQALSEAMRNIEHMNNMPNGTLKQMLAKNNIPLSTLHQQLKATLIWRDYIQGRYGDLVQISDTDVEHALKELKANNDENRYHLAEIALYFDNNSAAKVKEQAQRIVSQLKKGGQFSMLANQFSNAPSAQRGGDIGWIPESKLPQDIVEDLKTLTPGQITKPLKAGKIYRIYFLRDKLKAGEFSKPSTTLTFKQVFVANPKDAFNFEIEENLKQVSALSKQIKSCHAVEKLTAPKKAKVQHVQDVPLETLPPELQKMLLKTAENRATQTVYTGDGAMFFFLCKKQTTSPSEPSKDQMRAQLVDKKLQNIAEQELRTRRGGAHIEIR